MPRIKVHGAEVYFSFRKRKPPSFVFLHGAGGNHLNWFYQIEHLPFTTIAPDLPGHGNSSGNPATNAEEYASVIHDLLRKLAETPPILVGHSFGGHVALKVAENGLNVRGIVLISSAARLPRLNPPGDPEVFCRNMFYSNEHIQRCLQTAERILEQNRASLEADLEAAARSDVTEILKNLKVPVLFIFGTKDRILDPKEIERTINLPASAKTYFLNAGHMVMIEKYKRVNEILAQL